MKKALLTGAALAGAAFAQQQHTIQDRVFVRSGAAASSIAVSSTAESGMATLATPIGGGVRVFSADPVAVKGAPYSADVVSESTQALADGNRIVHKNSSKQYRDSEGRTRFENTLGMPAGPNMAFFSADGRMSVVFISDPVGGVHYTLHPDTKTAEKVELPKMIPDGKAMAGHVTVARRVELRGGNERSEDVLISGPVQGPALMTVELDRKPLNDKAPQPTRTKTSLGKRVIEGVEADGTKIVEVFPAGMFGNERALETVSEEWYSNELKMVVLRKHNDPRFGENTYKLTNLVRGEPSRSLFEVPADYKMREAFTRTRIEKD